MVSRDAEVWAARQTIRMHETDQDGPAGRCKTCPEDGSTTKCYMLNWAKGILALELAAAQVAHPQH